MFVDKIDPRVVYVHLRTKLRQCILADFFLEDALRLIKRLHDAFPDTLVCTRNYTEKIRLTMSNHKDDPKYSRLQGLKDASKVMGMNHQHEFDAELMLNEEAYQLKEPFSRDIRRKMMECQKFLTGNDKFVKLGNLKSAKLELLGWYATGSVPKPSINPNKEVAKSQNAAPTSKPEKRKGSNTPKKTKKVKKSKTQKTKDNVESKKSTKGEKRLTTAKLKEMKEFTDKMAKVGRPSNHSLFFQAQKYF